MNVDFLKSIAEDIRFVCVSDTWIHCDEGSFRVLGNDVGQGPEWERGSVVAFYSSDVAVWVSPDAVSAVSSDIPLRLGGY